MPDSEPVAGNAGLSLLGRRRRASQWVALLAVSAALVVLLEALHLPAAMMLGPMAAAILVASANGTIRVPAIPFQIAQGVVGCMMARSIPLSTLSEIVRDWPLFMAGVASTVVAAGGLGWILTRWQVFPGTTAVWGSSPGAATSMTLLAEAHGADIRLVAFMQYLRVVCVVVVASLVSRIWVGASGHVAPPVDWLPAIAWGPFTETGALIAVGIVSARLWRIPAGQLLVPMAVGVVLQGAGLMTIELPPWLLAASYALVGWSIGLRFTRSILVHAARELPKVLASILVLIVVCGGFAALLVVGAGIDPLTAYLATSPGGADSAAIIAASSNVDVPFVMAMQTARVLVVLVTGPSLARFIARRAVPVITASPSDSA